MARGGERFLRLVRIARGPFAHFLMYRVGNLMTPPADRYPLLKNLHIDSHRKPLREPDIEWVAQLADGIRSGRQMKPVGVEACSDGGWHVTYGYHTFLAIRQIHGPDSKGETIRATECHYTSKIDHILDQAKDNNIKPFKDEEWKQIIEQLLEVGMIQTQIALKIGRSKSWVTMKLNPEKYEDRPDGRVYAVNAALEKISSDLAPVNPPLEHEFTSPLDPTLDPEISAESATLDASTQTYRSIAPLADSNGAMGADKGKSRSQFGTPLATKHPIQPAPGPSYLDRLKALRHEFEELSSLSTYRKVADQDAPQFDAIMQWLHFRSGDWLISAPRGEWTGEAPRAKEHRVPFRIHEGEEVSVRRPWKSGVVKALTDAGARIRYMANGKPFHEVVPYRDILAKVNA